MKTVSVRQKDVAHDWYVIDAAGQTLGRLASEIAKCLRGKHKSNYTPHVDTGDYIIVVNAEKIFVSGKKETKKIYYRHSGYPGGIKSASVKEVRETKPTELLERAVKGMLPRNPLGRSVFRKLKVYAGDSHPHGAQQPKEMVIT
jgi:large subunit ribosomal protein L13